LTALARLPRDDERIVFREAFSANMDSVTASDKRQAAEDILWALLNSKEFLYNH